MKSKRQHPAGRMQSLVLEGRVRDVTDVGDAVVETERGIVMVSGALPDEQVRVRADETRAGVMRGELLSILSPSPERIESPCGISERCGGCPLISLALPGQHRIKQRRVQRAVEGLCEPGASVQLEAADETLAYRRRARLSFRKVGAQVLLGYHVHASRQVIDVAQCVVLTPALAAALGHVRRLLLPLLTGLGSLDLDGLADGRVSVAVHCEQNQEPEVYRAAEQVTGEAEVFAVSLRIGDGAPARFGATSDSDPALADDGKHMEIPRHGFSQVNAAVNARLHARVLELAEPSAARVLELYAGHGNFTLALAEQASALLAVEGESRAADACRENLRARAFKQARVQTADVRELRLRDRERYDVLVLDPPRAGCPTLAALVAQARPIRIVYISCHMTTLQRDLRALHQVGYVADRVHALDMFPQTGHVEAVVRMRRAAN